MTHLKTEVWHEIAGSFFDGAIQHEAAKHKRQKSERHANVAIFASPMILPVARMLAIMIVSTMMLRQWRSSCVMTTILQLIFSLHFSKFINRCRDHNCLCFVFYKHKYTLKTLRKPASIKILLTPLPLRGKFPPP